MTDTWPTATRKETRGRPPAHDDHPRIQGPLTRAEALRIARKRLADWIESHPDLSWPAGPFEAAAPDGE